MSNGAVQQREVPGFIFVDIVQVDPPNTYRTLYVNPRCIAEFGHQYILVDQAHSLDVRQSLGDIAKKIENVFTKHCPEDKAVGEVVKAARNVVSIYHRAAITCEAVDAVIKLEVALADYEANK